MIIKIIRTSSSSNLLNYLVNQEHEVLDAKGVLPYQDFREIRNEFKMRELTNSRAENIAYNIIVSFPAKDTITKSMRANLLEEIMLEFNGGSDLWYAVSHCDTPNHQHFHIALSAIKLDGLSIDMSNFAKRAKELSRKLEIKYSLTRISNQRTLGSNEALGELKFTIDHAINEAQNMEHFIEIMRLSGYKCKVGRGITFIKLENNHPIKGSDVGRVYSLGNLKKNFEPVSNLRKDEKRANSVNTSGSKADINLNVLDLIFPSPSIQSGPSDSVEDDNWKKKKRKKRKRR